jgi:hypothetical protein
MIMYSKEDFLKLKANIRPEEAETNEYAAQILDFIESNQVLREMKSDIEPEDCTTAKNKNEPEQYPEEPDLPTIEGMAMLKRIVDNLEFELLRVKNCLVKHGYK